MGETEHSPESQRGCTPAPRALLIDDSRAARRHVASLLERQGWQVHCAEDAAEGAAAALSHPPDLVISDLWMPGLSGLQLCRLLAQDPVTSGIPIVLMSARLDRQSLFWAKHSGAALAVNKDQLGELFDALPTLVPFHRGLRTPASSVVSVDAVPTRLSQLLDRMLFESVVAQEVRALGFAANVRQLFEGLVALLSQLLSYRWLGLVAGKGAGQIGCAHVHPDDQAAALPRALGALKYPTERDLVVVADDRGRPDSKTHGRPPSLGSGGQIVSHAIELGDVKVGRVALETWGPELTGLDQAVFDLARAELAPVARAVWLSEETRRLASTDMLTELWNRRQGGEYLEQAVAGARRYGHALSVAMLDIDHFKNINDTYGHASGDLALQQVSAILRRTVRKADAAVRWGGEEFLVVMPSTGAPGARVAGERFRQAVCARPLQLEGSEQLVVTVSVGLASFDQDGAPSLLSRADKALYAAKRRGRNRVEVG